MSSGKQNPTLAFSILCAAGTLVAAGLSGCAASPLSGASGDVFVAADGTETQNLRQAVRADVAAGVEDFRLSPEDIEIPSVKAYADYLLTWAEKKGVSLSTARVPISALVLAFAVEKHGDSDAAESAYGEIVTAFPDSDFAAEALYRLGELYSNRRQFEPAFECFSALEDAYPASPRVDDAIVQAYLVTEMVRKGVRPTKGGSLLWFKDRTRALDFYDRLYEMAPHLPISPRLLYHKGLFAFELSHDWFSFDKTLDAIDAFERMISIYPDATFVPNAYLDLAATYEAGVVGPDWDQLATRRAINYYTDFYQLFPDHPKAEFAYEKTISLTNLMAENRLVIGDFYYSRHNNLRAAVTFYNEALTLAPDSPAGKKAQERIDRIRRGERAPRTWVDWLFGRYPNYDAVDYLDMPSQKSLDEMGFRNSNVSPDSSSTGPASSESTETLKPGET